MSGVLNFFNGQKIETEQQFTSHKSEVKAWFLENVYGVLPKEIDKVEFVQTERNENYNAGKSVFINTDIAVSIGKKSFSFPVRVAFPKGEIKGTFLHINFRPEVPDRSQPTEEILDNGYCVASFCYKQVTDDNADFTDGLSGLFYPDGKREKTDAGKIAIWSKAARLLMDYLETLPEIDTEKVMVIGHSRLGKTAILTGVCDERFCGVIANNSGCMGAALSHNKSGESMADIYKTFPFWFCENFESFAKNPELSPADQDSFLSLIAPRKLYVASAKDDLWAGPESEYLSLCNVARVYEEIYNIGGFETLTALPDAPYGFTTESLGYHIRLGTHYLSRTDWLKYLEFFK